MKIASVTFYNPKLEKGGGCTPAFAFADWTDIIYSFSTLRTDVLYNPDVELLNESYDAVFFATPPRSPDWDFSKLKIPFVVMIHVHNDLQKYPWFHYMIQHKMCKGVAQIEASKSGFFHYIETVPVFPWTPCGHPSLLTPANVPITKQGMLYASRVCPWKNAHQALLIDPACKVFGSITDDYYAKANGIESEQFEMYSNPAKTGQYDLIFNVFGSIDTPMIVKRLDLTAWEAMHYGVMPLVNHDAMPDSLKGAFIELDPMKFNKKEAQDKISFYRQHKTEMWNRMKEKVLRSEFSYSNVQLQIKRIVTEGLLC